MGYDLTLLTGEVVPGVSNRTGLPWFRVRSTFDFWIDYAAKVLHLDKEDGIAVYFYAPTEGDTEVTEDSYGNTVVALPLEPVLKALKKDGRDYTLAECARQWLELMAMCPSSYPNLETRVILWGH